MRQQMQSICNMDFVFCVMMWQSDSCSVAVMKEVATILPGYYVHHSSENLAGFI